VPFGSKLWTVVADKTKSNNASDKATRFMVPQIYCVVILNIPYYN